MYTGCNTKLLAGSTGEQDSAAEVYKGFVRFAAESWLNFLIFFYSITASTHFTSYHFGICFAVKFISHHEVAKSSDSQLSFVLCHKATVMAGSITALLILF